MGIENLERMFQPKTIAVVGASEKKESIGLSVMQNLIDCGFNGRIYPVNPKHSTIMGKFACKAMHKLPEPADLVIIATPIATVPEITAQCLKNKAGGAVVISAGGKEIGESGMAIEAEIKKQIHNSGFRIIGPNCLGIISTRHRLNAGFAPRMPIGGKMAFISQSGAICTAILDYAARTHLGFSYFISLGSMLDVDFGDMIDYLGSDPAVSSIVMYVENLTRVRNFMSAARAVSRIKPIIALKAGRTRAGAIAAASHTGAMAGEDLIYDAAFKRAGIVRVKTFAELFDCASFIGKQTKSVNRGLAIVTNAGGPGVMAVDALSDYGLEPLSLSGKTLARLNAVLPDFWSHANPVDILGDATAERYRQVIEILMDASEVDGILVMLAPQRVTDPVIVAHMLAEQFRQQQFPVLTSWLGGVDVEPGRSIFEKAGIPTFDSPERAIRAYMNLYKYWRNIEMLQQIPGRLPENLYMDRKLVLKFIQRGLDRPNGLLTEVESKSVLAAYGINVNPTRSALNQEEAIHMADEIGYPVALKINSSTVIHKSESGGVFLNLADADALRNACGKILEKFGPDAEFSVQEMIPKSEFELIAGVKKDPWFGPVILFGMGGTLTEIFGDIAVTLPPLNRMLARRLIEETRICKVLKGYRGLAAVDTGIIEELLIRLSQLVIDYPQIDQIDINPIVIKENLIYALDARIIVGQGEVAQYKHLSISPYPEHLEEIIDVSGIGNLLIRPIRPEDAPLLEAHFNSLSERSVYFRFFGPMKKMPHHMLARFTQIDYDREIAMVAILQGDAGEKMIGVGRIIMEPGRKAAEFAVVVADQYHGKGIGAILMRQSLAVARKMGIEKVYGIVLPGNTSMLALGKKLGFSIKQEPGQYELTLDMANAEGQLTKMMVS